MNTNKSKVKYLPLRKMKTFWDQHDNKLRYCKKYYFQQILQLSSRASRTMKTKINLLPTFELKLFNKSYQEPQK